MTKEKNVFKWIGGKYLIKDKIIPLLPPKIKIYSEPFLGAGTIFLNLKPQKALLNDLNTDIINFFNVLKFNVYELIDSLNNCVNSKDHFYKIRDIERDLREYNKVNNIEKASRFLFLNKTCFCGTYRVNKNGCFNTGYGFYKNIDFYPELLKDIHIYLNNSNNTFYNLDFEYFINNTITKNTFFFLDPPYDKLNNSFYDQYTKYGFKRNEQDRLKNICDELTRNGNKFILTNSKTDYLLNLYKNYDIIEISNRLGTKHKKECKELIIKNY